MVRNIEINLLITSQENEPGEAFKQKTLFVSALSAIFSCVLHLLRFFWRLHRFLSGEILALRFFTGIHGSASQSARQPSDICRKTPDSILLLPCCRITFIILNPLPYGLSDLQDHLTSEFTRFLIHTFNHRNRALLPADKLSVYDL